MSEPCVPTEQPAAAPAAQLTMSRADGDRSWALAGVVSAAAGGASAVASVAAPVAQRLVVRAVRSRLTAVVTSPWFVGTVASFFVGPVPVLMLTALLAAH